MEGGEEEEEAESQSEGQREGGEWRYMKETTDSSHESLRKILMIINTHSIYQHLHWIISDEGNEYQTDQQSSQIH